MLYYDTNITKKEIKTKAQTLLKFTTANALLKDQPNKKLKQLNYYNKHICSLECYTLCSEKKQPLTFSFISP